MSNNKRKRELFSNDLSPEKKIKTKVCDKRGTAASTSRSSKRKVPILSNENNDSDAESNYEYCGENDDVKNVKKKNPRLFDLSDLLAEQSGISSFISNNFIRLIEDDNTIPFIARYRKSMTDNMSPEKLYELHELYNNICTMKKKALYIIESLKKKDKLTADLERSICNAKSIDELEIIYEPYRTRNGTLADRARKLGLEDVAKDIFNGKQILLSSFCRNNEEELRTEAQVETHVVHLLAEMLYKNSKVLEFIRKLKSETSLYIQSSLSRKTKSSSVKQTSKSKEIQDVEKYNAYFDFKMKLEYIKPHQILALNRGEASKILTVKVVIPEWFYNKFERYCLNIWHGPLISKATLDAYNRYIQPWISRQVRSEMTNSAIKESVSVFAMNLKRLLMTSPIKGHNIVGIDPGFKAGCKIGVIGISGQVLHTCILYPNFKSLFDEKEVKKMRALIKNYNCGVIALGNGTACRETEEWLRNNELNKGVSLVIVPEQGASIYSCCSEALKEHQGLEPNLISAISIARRALDPLSELVKVDPKHIGVGLYQHDVPQKLLDEALNDTVITCASFVGADLNTASLALLRKIAGLTETRAKNILKYREANGLFKSRKELLKVPGIGPKVFKQCSGFLRVLESTNKLDTTWIHPESYGLAMKILKEMHLKVSDLGKEDFIAQIKEKKTEDYLNSLVSKYDCHKSDVQLIMDAFSQHPHEDLVRSNKPIYSMSVNNPSQLEEGTSLIGIVSNVTPFGCFVDCGVRTDGLIHNSKMNGLRMPQLGERVMVTIIPKLTANRMPLSLVKIL